MSETASKYTLVASLDPIESGQRLAVYPVHAKVLPWFEVDVPPEVVAEELTAHAASQPSFEMEGLGCAWLGEHSNRTVRMIGDHGLLLCIHQSFSEVLESIGGRYQKPQYCGQEYAPHISLLKTGVKWIRQGQEEEVRQLHLLEHSPEQLRVIAAMKLRTAA